jgi:hypothetical protein
MVLRGRSMLLAATANVELEGADVLAVQTLHDRCGVYTKLEVVKQILNAVGWTTSNDLAEATLLEPSAGDGAFLTESAHRLVLSLRRHGSSVSINTLGPRIRSFELHPREAAKARENVKKTLAALGVHVATADACARMWISNADFLLANVQSNSFSHVVGNPPYVRWSKIPTELRSKYEQSVSREMTGGDLFVPFLDRALDALKAGRKCGLLCSNRWRYMAFGEAFRSKWLPRLDVHSEKRLAAESAFVESVDSYPSILVATKRAEPTVDVKPAHRRGNRVTLADAGCLIRVGPALGHTPAFVLERDELDAEVESEYVAKWVAATEISEGKIDWAGRRVLVMNNANGELIDLNRLPKVSARLERFRVKLSSRAIVQNGAPWFRPIDRVRKIDWARPKILVPELAKTPRCAIDRSGLIPSHGVYSIFAPDDNVEWLYEQLGDGHLARELRKLAPRVKGDYVRCYKRFLEMVKVTPPRSSLS